MLPKSNKRLLVGFNDGLHAVKYYNKDTKKILTSRNYKFIQNQKHPHLMCHRSDYCDQIKGL